MNPNDPEDTRDYTPDEIWGEKEQDLELEEED